MPEHLWMKGTQRIIFSKLVEGRMCEARHSRRMVTSAQCDDDRAVAEDQAPKKSRRS